jgi:adhesin transport system outer membrane protein
MTTPVQLAYKNLLLVCMACVPVWAQAQTTAPAPAPSPTLASLVRDALDSHPTTQSQRALVASAAAGVESARWQFYPTPSVSLENATTSGADPSYQGDNRVATLRLQQPLYSGGRLTAGADKAQASLDQSQAALEESRLQLSLRVVQAYGEWLSAHLKVQASQKNEDSHNRLLRQVERRIDEGVSAESDRVLALGRLDAVRAEVTAAQVQGDMALARLGQLLADPLRVTL